MLARRPPRFVDAGCLGSKAAASWRLNERKCICWGFLAGGLAGGTVSRGGGGSEPGPVQASRPVCAWPGSSYILNVKKLEAVEVLWGRSLKVEPCLQSERLQAPMATLSVASESCRQETAGAFPRLRAPA